MHEDFLKLIQGKSICIDELRLIADGQINLSFCFQIDNQNCCISCLNVSEFRLRELNYPIWISGFEIRDNAENGWENCVRYTVRDFEEDSIFFHCQDIQVVDMGEI